MRLYFYCISILFKFDQFIRPDLHDFVHTAAFCFIYPLLEYHPVIHIKNINGPKLDPDTN